MVIMAVAGRETTRELAIFQIMEMRSIIGLFMLYPLIRMSGGFATMKTSRPLQHVARNLVHYGAQYGWFLALSLIPLAQVVSIEFTMPIWTAVLAVSFLGERMNVWKILAVVLGLIGVAVIVRPVAGEINPGQMVALAAAIGFGISIAMVKSLTRTESVVSITFWMLVVQSVVGLIPALSVWLWPSAYAWCWIVVIAFCGTFSHYCMARAMPSCRCDVVADGFSRVPLTQRGWLIYRAARYHDNWRRADSHGNLLNLNAALPRWLRRRRLHCGGHLLRNSR